MRARRLLRACMNENASERDLCWERGELRPMVGEKEVVTKEWENEDGCVGEGENNRKAKKYG